MNTRQIDIFNYKRRSTVEVNIGGVTVSGKLYVNGSQVSITSSNYMDYIGRKNSSHESKITNLTWVAPTN